MGHFSKDMESMVKSMNSIIFLLALRGTGSFHLKSIFTKQKAVATLQAPLSVRQTVCINLMEHLTAGTLL